MPDNPRFDKELALAKARVADIAADQYEYAHLGLDDDMFDPNIVLHDPFSDMTEHDFKNPSEYIMSVLMNPDYFGWTCKHLMGIDLLPMQCAILRELWWRPFPLLCASRGYGKSFLLALYAVLRALFIPGRKIVITGAGFRQSKIIFGYAETIWNSSPVLRDICGVTHNKSQGVHHGTDLWWMEIGDSVIKALPLGSGDKIRGQRANDILTDEFASVPREIFEETILGFAVVAQQPVERVKEKARINKLKKRGLWTPEQDSNSKEQVMGNQIVLSGTASFSFNHFYEYWKRYKNIITSGGDKDKMKKAGIEGDLDHNGFSIIRIPVELVPEGFMDEKHIERARNTVNSSIYLNEYGACASFDTRIITDSGTKEIKDIVLGDLVLTHKGRFRKVEKIFTRPYHGEAFDYKSYGYFDNNIFTPEHPFLSENESWETLDKIKHLRLANLKELTNIHEINIVDYVSSDYLEYDDYVYSRPGSSRLDRHIIKYILDSPLTPTELSRELNIRQSTVWNIKNLRKKTFNAIPKKIKLDFNFGLIIGYYAAEGSVGARGRAVDFALDGHVSCSLEHYVDQLCDAIKIVFGTSPKKYCKDRNTLSVVITNVLIADLMKSICPGVAHNKNINPYILYSNADFMRGFIVGYWNGDCHISTDTNSYVAGSCSIDLLTQVKTVLSYFNVTSSLKKRAYRKSVFRGKECNSRTAYDLSITRDGVQKFLKIFYDREFEPKNGSVKIINDGNYSILPVIELSTVEYDGLVYNLEVEEDHSYSTLNATVHNCFANDSNGFYKRTLIEHCCISPHNIIRDIEVFYPTLWGKPDAKYIFGIDPASMQDNFSIVILEAHPDHARVVYAWSTNNETHKERVESSTGKADKPSNDFYAYCTRKIRDLMKIFPCIHIAMDAQGGGRTIAAALQNEDYLQPGETAILEINEQSPLWDHKERDSDDKPGLHILQLVQFVNSDYTYEANHGLKSDFEHQTIIFPFFDTIEIFKAGLSDLESKREYDTLEDVVMEIEDLKDEITMIQHGESPQTKRERWGAPEVKAAGTGKKGLLHDDRYCSFLMANTAARRLREAPQAEGYKVVGGFVGQKSNATASAGGPLYYGPSWVTEQMKTCKSYGLYVDRSGRNV